MRAVFLATLGLLLLGCRHQGVPSFPIGVYGVTRPAEVDAAVDAGVDVIHTDYTAGEGLEGLLRRSRERGAQLMFNPATQIDLARSAPSWPRAIWYLQDEPDVHRVTRSELSGIAERVRKWDPLGTQAFSVGQGTAAFHYTGIGDALLLDWYPVPHGLLSSVGDQVGTAVSADPSRPLWFIVQAMNWRDYLGPVSPKAAQARFPTLLEIRFMAYLAISRGARGIFFFTMVRPGGRTILDFPEEWHAVATVAKELRLMARVFGEGKIVSVPQGPFATEAASVTFWRWRGRLYGVLLGSTHLEPVPKGFLSGRWRLLFENRGLRVRPGEAPPAIGPGQVMVLEGPLLWMGNQ